MTSVASHGVERVMARRVRSEQMQGPRGRDMSGLSAHGGDDEIPGFHLFRHAPDHGGRICTDLCHPCLGDVGVPVEQDPERLYRIYIRGA